MDPELKKLLDEQNKAWAEFKSANDERIKAVETGKASADLEAKVATINSALSTIESKYKERIEKLELDASRPRLGGDEAKTAAAELKSINLALAAHSAERGGRFEPLSVDQYAQYKSGLETYLRKGERALSADEFKTLSIGTDSDGGYVVTPAIEAAITRVQALGSAMRSVAEVMTIGTASTKKVVNLAGTGSGWAGETETPSETATPKLAELEFTPGKLYAEPHATSDLLEDASIDIEAWLAGEVDIAFSEGEGAAFITGNGIKKPMGLLAYTAVDNSAYAWGSLGFVVSGAAGDFAATNPSDKLIDLVHALKRGYRAGASWLMNDLTLAKVRKFKDGQGNYLWVPGLQNGVVGQLLGYPVVTDDFMPDVGANAFPVAFADFKRGYRVVDRRGVTVLRDPFTRKPYVKFYTTKRVGGGVQNFEAIKLLKIST